MRVAVFDMDGTLIKESSWKILHQYFGVEDFLVQKNFDDYVNNKISFKEWVERDILLWKNPSISEVKMALSDFTVSENTDVLFSYLRDKNFATCIVTSGINFIAEALKEKFGIDYIFCNELFYDGRLKGRVKVDLRKKGEVLKNFLDECNVEKAFIVVGDSEFDVLMFEHAKLKIAYKPKDERIKKASDYVIHDLKDILELL